MLTGYSAAPTELAGTMLQVCVSRRRLAQGTLRRVCAAAGAIFNVVDTRRQVIRRATRALGDVLWEHSIKFESES